MTRRGVLSQDGSLTDRVYRGLRQEILSCALPPGQPISEGELADRFGVSKTPVREALNTLRQEGLVQVVPRRGYQIAPITLKALTDVFELRLLLESSAAEMAAQRITPQRLDELARLADVGYDRTERPSLQMFIQANRNFHVLVTATSGNERIRQLVECCLDELERVFYIGADVRDISAEVRHDHHALVDALRAGDGARARALAVEQIERTRSQILGAFFAAASGDLGAHLLISRDASPVFVDR